MKTNKLYKERLLKLSSYLKAVEPEFFDLDVICDVKNHGEIIGYYDENHKVDIVGFKKRDKECGTVACAVGHCPVVFPNQFKYVLSHDGEYEVHLRRNTYDDTWADVEHFFGIGTEEADYLFQPEWYPEGRRSALDVATRIEYFVRSGNMTGDRKILI